MGHGQTQERRTAAGRDAVLTAVLTLLASREKTLYILEP
jgi:hypothetical protein